MFTLVQTGGHLKSVNSMGQWSSALTLPSGVVLATNRVPRFAKFKQFVVVVNTPTRPVSVDTDGTVRLVTPSAPSLAVALTGPNAGSLSGTYLALQTYKLLDASGNVIAESDYGPAMATAVTIASKKLLATFALSVDDVDATQLYRTDTSGAVYFPWVLVDGNTATTAENDLSDDSLGVVAGPELGAAPDLTLVCEWGGRVWGVARDAVDNLRYTQAGTMYGWSALNVLPIPHVGADAAGVTALIPRRNALGVPRLTSFQQVTGSTRTNIAPTVVQGGENMGCVSQESADVFNDVAYFLWYDGVYKWDASGISSVSNGKVRSWFTSDLYFNRAMFWRAIGKVDPITLKYRLFLASVGSSMLDRWIEFDLQTGAWFGPHKTDAFSPSSVVLVAGANTQPYYMVGSQDGYLSQDQDTRNDWGVAPVDMVVEMKDYNEAPDQDKYFGELSVMTQPQDAGTLTITPSVGELGETVDQTPFEYDMTEGRQRLGRIGTGKEMSLTFENAEMDQDAPIFGYEIAPVSIVGRR
jgi:hypothetical protein